MPHPLNLAVIGAGRIGQLHAENIAYGLAGARLVALVDADEERARACAAQIGVDRVYADYRALLDDPEVEALVVCSPTDTHVEIIEAAAAAGKHLFCEKPIDQELARIDRALEAVERAGVKLQVGFNRRFDANYRRVREAVASGEIGTPHLLHLVSRDPAPPPIAYVERSGGLFLDMTIHDFDMARFLIGDEVEEVYAVAGVRVDPAIGAAGDVDTALIVLKFAGGVIGTIDNSRQAVYGYDQRVEVFGSGGSIETANNFPNSAEVRGAGGIRRDLPLNFFLDRYRESYGVELAAFIDAVRGDRPVPVDGRDGRVPVLMALAARRSVDENRPVRLAEVETAAASARGTGETGAGPGSYAAERTR